MANFTEDLHSLRPQFPFFEIDPSIAQINQLTEINQSIQENSNFNIQSSFLPISNDHIIFNHQVPEFTMDLAGNFPPNSHQINNNGMAVSLHTTGNDQSEVFGSKKIKAIDVSPECSSLNSSPHISVGGIIRKNSSRRGKRVKSHEEKPKDVVHVRARRGQATDSHSLAERVRRGRINERLRCLRDIVPGCYKSMGMAVMLDEIINYVQSLQNQVEFLSMKLTAASTFYDFNAEADVIDAMQRAKAQEAKGLERVMREGCGGPPSFHSSSAWTL